MRFSLLVLIVTVWSGCSLFYPGGSDDTVLFSGTSFGECMGYCIAELTVDGRSATILYYGWTDELEDVRHQRALSAAERRRLDRAFDRRALRRADEVYGCPDCADGGAEWVGATFEDGEKRVTFEYGASVRGLNDYIEVMRDLRASFPDPPRQ